MVVVLLVVCMDSGWEGGRNRGRERECWRGGRVEDVIR